jgi:hypothetical protein
MPPLLERSFTNDYTFRMLSLSVYGFRLHHLRAWSESPSKLRGIAGVQNVLLCSDRRATGSALRLVADGKTIEQA